MISEERYPIPFRSMIVLRLLTSVRRWGIGKATQLSAREVQAALAHMLKGRVVIWQPSRCRTKPVKPLASGLLLFRHLPEVLKKSFTVDNGKEFYSHKGLRKH